MFFHVSFVISMSIEAFPALLTIITELPSVDLQVLGQAASCGETFTALLTRELLALRRFTLKLHT